MKKIIGSVIFALIVTVVVAFAQYLPDIIVTGTNGPWTDSRAYVSLNAAITAIGTDQRNVYIIRQENFAGAIPANVNLHFLGDGSINATGAVTINTKSIEGPNDRIFYGASNYDFIRGSILKCAWFEDFDEAILETVDDELTLVMTRNELATITQAIGNAVTLKWESSGNSLSINTGIVVSNIKQIEAGDYKIVKGVGRFDFNNGAVLRSTWFSQLRVAGKHIDNSEVTLEIRKSETLDYDYVFPITTTFKPIYGNILTDSADSDLTINGEIIASPGQRMFNWGNGTGDIILGMLGVKHPELFGALDDSGVTDNTDYINDALEDGGIIELRAPNGGHYEITGALTIAVAGTKFRSINNAEIVQATSNTPGINITVSNVDVIGIKLTGPQFAVSQANENGINTTGADSANYITDINILGCDINTWGRYGIYSQFVDNFDFSDNKVYDMFFSGIACLSDTNGLINKNKITDITGNIAGRSYGIFLTRIEHNSLVTHPRCSYITVDDNEVYNVTDWTAYDTHGGEEITFSNNRSYDCFNGLAVGSANNGGATATFAPLNVNVIGNTFNSGVTDGTAGFGISYTGALNVQSATGSVVGNIMDGFGDEDFATGTAMSFFNTDGVIITGNSILRPGRMGVLFGPNNVGTMFKGNTIFDAWSETFNPYGVRLNGANNTPVIEGNYFAKGTKAAAFDFSSAVAIAVSINDVAGNTPQIGRNYIKDVTWELNDDGFNAAKIDLSSSATSGVGEDDLSTFPIEAGMFARRGFFSVQAAGTKSGANDNKTLKFYVGATAITFHAAANNVNNWTFNATVVSLTSNSQGIMWVGTDGATVLSGYDTAAEDSTADFDIKLTGECANLNDTITQKLFTRIPY